MSTHSAKGTNAGAIRSLQSAWTQLLLTSAGDGTGVATLTMQSSSNTRITLGDNAKFYSDAAGTLNESSTWDIVAGADRTIYVKCTTGTATFKVDAKKITRWYNWDSPANAPSIGGSIEPFVNITHLRTAWGNSHNTLSGNIEILTKLQELYIFGNNTLSGSVADLTNLVWVQIGGQNTLTGSIENLTNLTMWDNISANCTHSGNVSNLTKLTYFWDHLSNNTYSGSIEGMTNLETFVVFGNNTLTGDIKDLTKLRICRIGGNNTISCSSLSKLTDIQWLEWLVNYTLSSAAIDGLLIDLWTNRNVERTANFRRIILTLNQASGTPTDTPGTGGHVYWRALEEHTTPGGANPPKWNINIDHLNLSAELVNQSTWNTPGYWNSIGSGFTFLNGKIITDGTSAYCIKNGLLTNGKRYYIEVEISYISGVSGGHAPYDGNTQAFYFTYSKKFKFYDSWTSNDLYIQTYESAYEMLSLSIKELT